MTCPRCDGSGRDRQRAIEMMMLLLSPRLMFVELDEGAIIDDYARCRLCGGTGWREIGGESGE